MLERAGLQKRIEIAVIAPSVPEEFFNLLWDGVSRAAFELDSFGVTVRTFKTRFHDGRAQSALLSEMLDSSFSAIAIAPAHPEALNSLIASHAERGRPVVTFHSDAPASERHSHVGTSAPEAGALAAEALAKFMGRRGKIAAFPGDFAFPQFAQRYQGFRRELERWGPELEEAFCFAGLDGLSGALERALDEHPDLGGIYVGSARSFHLAGRLEGRSLQIPFVGFDNTAAIQPFLRNGIVSAVIDESVQQQGYIAVQRAFEISVSRSTDIARWVRVPSSLVLAANSADAPVGETLNEAFEQLIRQQTAQLHAYREMLESANHRLIRLAETDGLTGLMNRRKFEEILTIELERARIHGRLSLLLVDVDAFKSCNDNYGHHVGDEALRTVARTLAESLRKTDYCARLGGDEFCALLPDTDRAAALEVRERFCDALKQTAILPGGLPVTVRASVGVATFPEDAETANDLVIAADRSMYEAKRGAKTALMA